jgi:deazaflavin-dependent oxidoreductase (nitroreductase family)
MSQKTFSGRMVNFMMTRTPGFAKAGTRRSAKAYAASGGTKSAAIMGKPTFLLNVVGRKSGEIRPVMLMLIHHGPELIVVGSQGGAPKNPNWWENLVAAGHAEAQVGAEKFPVLFRQVTDPTERAEVWKVACAAYPDFDTYRQLTSREIPLGILTRV